MCFRSLYDIVYPVHVGRVRQFNPWHAEVISGNNKSEFAFSIISQNWDGAGRWNITSLERIDYILHTILLTSWRCKEQWHNRQDIDVAFPRSALAVLKNIQVIWYWKWWKRMEIFIVISMPMNFDIWKSGNLVRRSFSSHTLLCPIIRVVYLLTPSAMIKRSAVIFNSIHRNKCADMCWNPVSIAKMEYLPK